MTLNSITEKLNLPNCLEFYAAKNHLTTFDDLPSMPKLMVLDLTKNNISSPKGIERFPNLCHLKISECPITENFRGQLASTNKKCCQIFFEKI